MTTDKARKRAVRSRMTKTGERYAAARRHVVAPPPASAPAPVPDPAPVAPSTAPGDPGWSDETIVKGTGHDWAHWMELLDGWGAMDRSHTEIARWLAATQGISGWWSQTVTVGYERARGRRALHQTVRGFEVSVSKTIRAPRGEVWSWLADAERRQTWVEADELEPTTARAPVIARFTVVGTTSVVEASLDPRADDRTTVTVTVRKLQDGDDVERQRHVWRARLARLDAAVMAGSAVARGADRAS